MISISSALAFCKEDISKIENYDLAVADTTQTWHCHHKRELLDDNDNPLEKEVSKNELIMQRKYYQLPAKDLIFLTPGDHISAHMKNRPKRKKGEFHQTEESKRKIREHNARRGKPGINKGKKATKPNWCNNGIINKRCGDIVPEGFVLGRIITEEARKNFSDSHKGKKTPDEVRKKLSEANKGKKRTEETRKRISEAKVGDKNPAKRPEVRNKIAEAFKGKHWKLVDGKRVWCY